MFCIDSCLDHCKLRPTEPDRAGAASRFVSDERAARASTPCRQAELVKHPRKLGKDAQARKRQLLRNRPTPDDPEERKAWEEELNAVKKDLKRVDETRLAHGFPCCDSDGVWQNLRTDTPASFFEEVLKRTLAELGLSPGEVKSIVQKGNEARASTPGGSRPMRAGAKHGHQGKCWGYGRHAW